MNDGKWKLALGCHRGTLMSRDTDYPQFYDTREEAIAKYKSAKRSWESIGYQVWFAYLTDPDGKETCLEQNPYW